MSLIRFFLHPHFYHAKHFRVCSESQIKSGSAKRKNQLNKKCIERIIFRPLLFRVTLCVSYLSKGKFIFILHMIKVKLISLTAQLGKLQSNHP
jgi:hypothetical protein